MKQTILAIAGAIVLVVGTGFIYWPLAIINAGLFLLAAAWEVGN